MEFNGAHLSPTGTAELLLASGPIQLRFLRIPRGLLLVSDRESNRWPAEIVSLEKARFRLPEGEVAGVARWLVDPREVRSALERFREVFQGTRIPSWLANPAGVLEVRLGARPAPVPTYPARLEAEFDRAAGNYDSQVRRNRIDLELRGHSLALLRRTFRPGASLLELGCGTGWETMALLEDGHELACLDISSRMLEELRAKATAGGVAERLRTEKASLSEWARGSTIWTGERWEGGFSTFGALNCEPDLRPVSSRLYTALRPRSAFVAGVLNRWPWLELVADASTGQWRRAAARIQVPIPAGRSRFGVEVYPQSPLHLERLFRPWFAMRALEAAGVAFPPPDRLGWTERFQVRWPSFASWDRRWGRRWPFRGLGDYSLATFERVERLPYGGG